MLQRARLSHLVVACVIVLRVGATASPALTAVHRFEMGHGLFVWFAAKPQAQVPKSRPRSPDASNTCPQLATLRVCRKLDALARSHVQASGLAFCKGRHLPEFVIVAIVITSVFSAASAVQAAVDWLELHHSRAHVPAGRECCLNSAPPQLTTPITFGKLERSAATCLQTCNLALLQRLHLCLPVIALVIVVNVCSTANTTNLLEQDVTD
mmetsp:Transcript_33456/g.77722  ORF Transcript_33456/g.77722 Transcript_33456/m.77722 type:complete len:210 (-) Transcript_33456:464-1093(-)